VVNLALEFPLFGHSIESEYCQFGQQDSTQTQAYYTSNQSESIKEGEQSIMG
jgi:hypothetical protein